MNAAAAFSHREAELLEQLAGAQEIDQAIAACSMALEQTACELAQDEQDEHARQRQQAVMALARRAPQLLRAAAARGELVVSGGQAAPAQSRQEKLRRGARAAGAFLLAALAVYQRYFERDAGTDAARALSLLDVLKKAQPHCTALQRMDSRLRSLLQASPGRNLPDFKVQDLRGDTLDSRQLRGKPLVILFWGKSDGYMRVYQNAFPLLMCLS